MAAACGAPWYVRNWIITGNPLYGLGALNRGLPTNPIHAGLHEMYRERFGLHTISFAGWAHVALRLVIGATVVLALGSPGLRRAGRNGLAFGISIVVALMLWLGSIPYTIAGIDMSMRVLTPAWAALAIAAGAMAPAIFGPSARWSFVRRGVLVAGCGLCGALAVVNCWLFPLVPGSLANMVLGGRDFPRDALLERRPPSCRCSKRAICRQAGC